MRVSPSSQTGDVEAESPGDDANTANNIATSDGASARCLPFKKKLAGTEKHSSVDVGTVYAGLLARPSRPDSTKGTNPLSLPLAPAELGRSSRRTSSEASRFTACWTCRALLEREGGSKGSCLW